MKKVSILMAAYNCENFIAQSIESCLKQTYKNIEIIIIDDASTDNTLNIINDFAKKVKNIKVFRNKNNIGYLRTFNKLITLHNGEYITFLDSDDLIDEEKISLQVKFLEEHPDYGACGTSYNQIDETNKLIRYEVLPKNHEEIVEAFKKNKGTFVLGSSVMIRSITLEKVGGYKEYFLGCVGEDFDWFGRITNITKVYNLPDILYSYRMRSGSLTTRIPSSIKELHYKEIIHFLYQQRLKNDGKDSLNSDINGLSELVENLEQPYKKDKGLLYRRIAYSHAKNNDFVKAFKTWFYSLTKSPLKLGTYKLFLFIIIMRIIPKKYLFKIINLLNISNFSKRL